jgi:hypothetical protein
MSQPRGGPQAVGEAAGHGADTVTRARLRQNRSRSSGGSTSASRSSESETSRWNAVAASRPSRVSATETARRFSWSWNLAGQPYGSGTGPHRTVH